MSIPVEVLLLVTEKGSFQFGFNPWAAPIKYLAIDVRHENIRLMYSPFSIIIRLLVVTCLVYWIWDKWIKT
jgi:hypothetical protein